MRIIPLILLFIIAIANGAVAQEDKKDYSEAFRLIEVWLDAQTDFEKLPGISAAIIRDQDVLWTGSWGHANIEDNVETGVETICSICSISKLFTSTAIMKLYDEGKLRLDDRIEDLLPWYNLEQKYELSGPVTIRSLLTHSSGLPREANYPYWTGPDFPFPSQEEMKKELGNQETLYPASTYFQYSNLAMSLLGEVVEEISGVPYDDYISNNILDPLGLGNTRTELPEDLYGQQLAKGYSAIQRNGERYRVNLFQANGIKPAAGFSSTVTDLGKFASWQFRLLDSSEPEILKPSTLKNMYNIHWMDPDFGTKWGLGFSVSEGPGGSRWVGHGGSCPGYRSQLLLNPETKMAFVVMINASGTSPRKYINGMSALLRKVSSKEKNKDNSKLKQFTGYYSSAPWGAETYISTWNGKLAAMSLPTGSPASLTMYKHIKGDKFYRVRDNDEPGETLTFIRDDEGNIISYKVHGNYYKKINP